jgi:mitochondrial chaperone BCS1
MHCWHRRFAVATPAFVIHFPKKLRTLTSPPRHSRSHFVNSFFLTAHFSEEDYPYDWLMLWLSRRPEWQRSREFETTTRSSVSGLGSRVADNSFGDEDADDSAATNAAAVTDDDIPGRVKTRVVFQPTSDTTHTIYYRGHWLRVKRHRNSANCEMLSISVVARNNSILKQLVLQAKREYEAEAVHRIQIYFADAHGSWRWTDSRHKRPMSSIVLNPGVKEMLLNDTKDFLRSEKWYADRGIPFRRGYLLHGVPGSGKSSLIHAIAGELALDIYVVSLSASWINDSTLTTLMGRVPARCIVLLEDLDAAFTRSTSRDDGATGSPDKDKDKEQGPQENPSSSSSSSRRRKDQLSDVNTLSLSGLLNALDGVAAAEGRLLFATTNHLERLDPALSRPGRMDVWIEFRNASKWQAENLFRNFFPSSAGVDDGEEVDEAVLDAELAGVEIPTSTAPAPASPRSEMTLEMPTPPSGACTPVGPASPAVTTADTQPSLSRLASSASSCSLSSLPSTLSSTEPSSAATDVDGAADATVEKEKPSPEEEARRRRAEEEAHTIRHAAPPLSGRRLAELANIFGQAIPDDEFSVAALQGYLLRNKTRPEAAAMEAAGWVIAEREMRERLRREKELREKRRREERERRLKEEKEKKAEEEAKAKKEEAEAKKADEDSSKADDKAAEASKDKSDDKEGSPSPPPEAWTTVTSSQTL